MAIVLSLEDEHRSRPLLGNQTVHHQWDQTDDNRIGISGLWSKYSTEGRP